MLQVLPLIDAPTPAAGSTRTGGYADSTLSANKGHHGGSAAVL
ncbi:hypothetical protein [Corynebacterium durum]|nr:hypothetical protein [Corynebacterium durum]